MSPAQQAKMTVDELERVCAYAEHRLRVDVVSLGRFNPEIRLRFEREIRDAIIVQSSRELARSRENDWPAKVHKFRKLMGTPVSTEPALLHWKRRWAHMKLIDAGRENLNVAYIDRDVAAAAAAIVDMVYTLIDFAAEMGLPMQELFAEVHRANMAKVGPDGKPIIDHNGKIRKPDGWQPPRIAEILERHRK